MAKTPAKQKTEWVIIIDNGESYSDHTHWTAAVCKSKEQADAIVTSFNAWVKRLNGRIQEWREQDDGTGGYKKQEEFLRVDPGEAPLDPESFPLFGFGYSSFVEHSASTIEVPVLTFTKHKPTGVRRA